MPARSIMRDVERRVLAGRHHDDDRLGHYRWWCLSAVWSSFLSAVQSRYCRTLRDLPCHGAVVRICLGTHRFYCRVIVPAGSLRSDCRSWLRPMGDKPVDIAMPCWISATRWVGKQVVVWRRSWEFIAAQTQSCGPSAKLLLVNMPEM